MDEVFPDKRKIVGLVEQAYEGKLCLPDFQRDFIWRRDEVADLLRSMLRRYYIGSLLLLRCDPERPPFAPACLRGARPLFVEPRPELLVLDGQQRLSSLLYALTAPNLTLKDSSQPRWFFLDLKLLQKEPDNDEIVFDRAKRELDGLDDPEVQYQRGILPCTLLLRSKDFLKWMHALDDWLRAHDPAEHECFRQERRDYWTEAVTDFQAFHVPLVELARVEESNPHAIARVCAIFEKLNSTGVELSLYDLLTARLYRSRIRLHDLWDDSCNEHKRIAEWSGGKADTNKFGILVLRTLALLRGLDPKPRLLINLAPENIATDWRRAASALERALELVEMVGEDGFGVFDRRWLPYFGLLPVLAALRAEIENRGLGAEARDDLRRWYWCNVFLQRYSSAVESKSRKDYAEMLAYWMQHQPEPSVFGEARARIGTDGYVVRDAASDASSIYAGVFCLLALRGARDWRRGETIQLQELHDHHLFPRAYLGRHGLTKKVEVNSVANRTLISDETNLKIKDGAPAEYVDSVEVFPAGDQERLLFPHFVSPDALAVMREATEELDSNRAAAVYERFRVEREAMIVDEIRKACGIAAPAHS